MARTKNRYIESKTSTKEDATRTSKAYEAGIYTRLSQDRKEETRDKSQSLENQENICLRFAKENGIQVIKVYQDYEYSGSNFQRPGFKEMMEDIRKRRINCIIVKDLSRFAREYLEIGNYIENVFPFLGVRFISVNDKLDTENGIDGKKSFEVAIKNIFNDLYAKDISKKTSSAKEAKMRQGYYTAAIPPFGYKAIKKEKGRVLIVDERAKEVVQEIFSLAYNGLSNMDIARSLTEKYNTPLQYRRSKEIFRDKKNKKQWDVGTVSQILKNEIYTGDLLQRVYNNKSKIKDKGKYRDKDEWIRVENTHEALVSKEVFEKIQKDKRNKNKFLYYRNLGKEQKSSGEEGVNQSRKINQKIDGKYDNLLICTICGNKFKKEFVDRRLKYEKEKCYRYHCRGNDKLKLEKVHFRIYETDIDRIVLSTVNRLFANLNSNQSLEEKLKKRYESIYGKIQDKIKELEKNKTSLIIARQKDYEAYVQARIDLSEFQRIKEKQNRQIETINREVEIYYTKKKNLKAKRNELLEFIKSLRHIKKENNIPLERELIDKLIEKIEVYPCKQLRIFFKFDIERLEDVLEEGESNYE